MRSCVSVCVLVHTVDDDPSKVRRGHAWTRVLGRPLLGTCELGEGNGDAEQVRKGHGVDDADVGAYYDDDEQVRKMPWYS